MQGLAHYAASASPTPSPPSSSKRGEQGTKPPAVKSKATSQAGPLRVESRPVPKFSSIVTKPPGPSSTSGPGPEPPIPSAGSSTSSTKKAVKRRRLSPPATAPSSSSSSAVDLPQNLTHTAQAALSTSEVLAAEPTVLAEESGEATGRPGYPGMSDDEVFRAVSWPEEPEDGWGIPEEVDPAECSDTLTAKVANFLRLKYDQGEHINTRLQSSSTFANPHIYSKLVDFVQISEHSSAFPSGGWLTRRHIEAEIPFYGPAALNAQQKAKQEATRRAQEVGKRKEISFQSERRAVREDSSGTARWGNGSGSRDTGRGSGGDGERSRDARGYRYKDSSYASKRHRSRRDD